MSVARALALIVVAGGANGCCTVQGHPVSDGLVYVLPDSCMAKLRQRDVDAYDAARAQEHPAFGAPWASLVDAAHAQARVHPLADRLASRPAPRPGADVGAHAELVVTDEVRALYAWSDGTDCDGAPFALSACLLSLDDALARRERDRELFPGTPPGWLPLLDAGPELLYVLPDGGPAGPVVWASMLTPDVHVAFLTLGTLLDTDAAWRAEGVWPPPEPDDPKRARFEAIHAEHNPGATLPW